MSSDERYTGNTRIYDKCRISLTKEAIEKWKQKKQLSMHLVQDGTQNAKEECKTVQRQIVKGKWKKKCE